MSGTLYHALRLYGYNGVADTPYTDFPLTPEKLFEVDNIEDFLNQREGSYYYFLMNEQDIPVQFFKPALRTTIKLELTQLNSWPIPEGTLAQRKRPLYCSIRPHLIGIGIQVKILYFYVIKCNWKSQSCVELELLMDVLNTFRGLYTFNDKTTIVREHVDRLTKYLTDPDDEDSEVHYPIFDKVNEEINPVLWGHKGNTFVHKNIGNGKHWNLVYRNRDDISTENLDNPVECFLVPDEDTICSLTTHGQVAGRITPDMLDEGVNYVVHLTENTGLTYTHYFNDHDVRLLPHDLDDTALNEHWQIIILLKKVGTKIKWFAYLERYKQINPADNIGYADIQCTSGLTEFIKVINDNAVWYHISSVDFSEDGKAHSSLIGQSSWTSIWDRINSYVTGNYAWSMSAISDLVTLDGINKWNKTDPKIIKIIKCPYCPEDFTIDSNDYIVVSNAYNYAFITGQNLNAIKLNNLNHKFQSTLKPSTSSGDHVQSVIDEYKNNWANYVDPTDENNFATLKDPKLFTSEFYLPKYVYDSFTLTFMLENISCEAWETYNTQQNGFECVFYTTSTINSRFAFNFHVYEVANTRDEGDYPAFIVASRNNEVTLYNVPYINQILSGYNYDVKNKNQANFMNWFNVGVGTMATLATTGVAIGTGGITVPMAIGTGASTITSLANAVSSTIKNERSIAEKLDQLKLQSASVMGSDDLDILERYNGNQLIAYYYQASDEVMDVMNRLFYYTGYRRKRMGVPYTDTRHYFNYIKCEPVLNISNSALTGEYLDELTRIMRYGYTIIHKTELSDNPYWDFAQKMNNVEESLLTEE